MTEQEYRDKGLENYDNLDPVCEYITELEEQLLSNAKQLKAKDEQIPTY
jgi:hypothetical protein